VISTLVSPRQIRHLPLFLRMVFQKLARWHLVLSFKIPWVGFCALSACPRAIVPVSVVLLGTAKPASSLVTKLVGALLKPSPGLFGPPKRYPLFTVILRQYFLRRSLRSLRLKQLSSILAKTPRRTLTYPTAFQIQTFPTLLRQLRCRPSHRTPILA
jgi:hypothetical protein